MAPENTLPAFRASLAAGDAGFELDVCLTADSVPIVIHDDSLDRTTDGEGFVYDLPYREMADLDAGAWFHPSYAGTRIPQLEEVLDLIHSYDKKTLLNIEIKGAAWRSGESDGTERIVLDLVNSYGLNDRVLFSSFQWNSLRTLRAMDSECALGVLAEHRGDAEAAVSEASMLKAYSIHPHVLDVLSGCAQCYADFAGYVFPYTVKDEITAETILKAGAHGCFADLPFN